MNIERAMELLNQTVNYIMIGRNLKETIFELIQIGFKEEELEKYFNFSASDIKDALEELKENEMNYE